MPPGQASELYYALLLKDLGCSSNASAVCSLFGADDRQVKRDLKLVDIASLPRTARFVARAVLPGASLVRRAARFVRVAIAGDAQVRKLMETRCERGAMIARQFQLADATADAIRSLTELWDGSGKPAGLKGDAIPLLSRVMGLAQTAEVFFTDRGGAEAASAVVRERRGTWFDPDLADAFESLRADAAFWAMLKTCDAPVAVAAFEPRERAIAADGAVLERIAGGFGMVIDAKSPWTYRHSAGVAEVAAGLARTLGLPPAECAQMRLAALVHDVGKLGISNLILDKPGRLTPAEMDEMKKHTGYTLRLLGRVAGFRQFAPMAASHHERLDGGGYHLGLAAADLSVPARILAVADMYEALAARRPYRQDLTPEEVMTILTKNAAGGGICPHVFAALKAWLAVSRYEPVKLAA
jgi:HD-GYP domain-containing protein (c-di-GMP phosphodiesterase class II)